MGIHATAVVDPTAAIDPSATIGPYVVVEGPVQIGPMCRISASATILGHTMIEEGCQIHSHAVVGDVPQDYAYIGGVSYCRIGRRSTIREGATVHRGTAEGSTTVVGEDCLLMTNSHVGHNCQIGDGVVLVSGAVLGGHVVVGPKATISGNVGVHQFVRIGELAMVSGLAKVVQDVPPFLLADRDGAIVGVNRIGLIRAKFSSAERKDVKNAHRILYRSGHRRETALRQLAKSVTTDAGLRLLDFMLQDSSRGVARFSGDTGHLEA